MPFRRRQVLAGALLPFIAPALRAQAGFPSKPIHIVVPFPPGGSTDLLARRIGDKLSVALKQPVIVENRPGAGGTIGAAHVAKSAPDGHTLLMGVTGSNAIGPALYPNLPYDAARDFAPLTLASVSPLLLVVNPKVPAKTLEQFVALARQKPRSVSHGTPGNGTSMHLTAEMFSIATGTELVHAPYKGSAAALNDLLGGQIDAMFSDTQVLMQMVKAGRVVPLAVTSARRHPMLPDVPTMAEKGYAGFEALSWQGLFAPAGTPPAVVTLLSEEINKALRSPDIQEYFGPTGLIVEGNTPVVYREFVDKELRKWGDIVRKAGVKLE
ncbi:MAG: Bug family tripartite tricarboxylate transporter substrate binding protein [Ramlibacter sp.]